MSGPYDEHSIHKAVDQPNLGLATTYELLRELMARLQVTYSLEPTTLGRVSMECVERMLTLMPAKDLSYRTMDS